MEGDLPNLPEDLLIDEILARLPVKSLLRFKCVCKNWYNLIESPPFIRNHFHNPRNQTRLLVCHHTRPIIPDSESNFNTDFYSVSDSDSHDYYELENNPLALAIFCDETLEVCPPLHENIIDFIQRFPDSHQIHIIGPIDGLFLLHTGFNGRNDRLAVCNPATEEFRLLPGPNFRFPMSHTRSNVFGFGFDPLREVYKVVWIPIFWPNTPSDHAEVALYTLGTDESWRQIENPNVLASVPDVWWRCPCISGSCAEYFTGEYLNGVFYWLVECGFRKQIVLFDMERDVFSEIRMPNDIKVTFLGLNLVLNNDSIALLQSECMSRHSTVLESIYMWVMKEVGCWTKRSTLQLGPWIQFMQPLGFWRSDKEIFFETTTNKLVLCNLNTRKVVDLGVHGDKTGNFIRVFKYKESLVSVKGGQTENPSKGKLRDFIRDFFAVSYEDEFTEEEVVVVEEEEEEVVAARANSDSEEN